ncbi:Envelope fusion protein [Eumeta japonica]|uniref:Envelope fusion protein n=1 Tax=Eumeta variegata TaxID=151549 RepID=A0A4C1TU06_EUMVA|nr:Envelope fusion protein [Eumeta japonica]
MTSQYRKRDNTHQKATLYSQNGRIETELVAALTHSNHGKISPLLLTPKQLRREIAKIKGHLPIGLSLPVEDTELYKMMSVKGAVAQESAIFMIELPLVNQEHFELFKVIFIPTEINYRAIAIKTNAEYRWEQSQR